MNNLSPIGKLTWGNLIHALFFVVLLAILHFLNKAGISTGNILIDQLLNGGVGLLLQQLATNENNQLFGKF